jgi:Uma2 family endonuclease
MSLALELPNVTAEEPAIPTEPIWRLTVEQYHAMVRNGILGEDDPVELLNGWLVTKMTKSTFHRAATKLVSVALEKTIPAGWYVDSQNPITLATSEPEPDAVVVRGSTLQYLDRHPGPDALALVVEVADASLRRDRSLKRVDYADAGIPVYWIVNLAERRVEVYTEPYGKGRRASYRQQRDYGVEVELCVVIVGREVGRVPVRDMLPPR